MMFCSAECQPDGVPLIGIANGSLPHVLLYWSKGAYAWAM